MVLRWQLSTHIREEKKRLEIGITQKYIRTGTNWDVYKRPSYLLRRVWWCLSHYHRTLHFRCSVEAMISLNLAISTTAVITLKLQLVTDAETFCKKKVDTSFSHDKTMLCVYSRTCHWKKNWKMPIISYTWTHPWTHPREHLFENIIHPWTHPREHLFENITCTWVITVRISFNQARSPLPSGLWST